MQFKQALGKILLAIGSNQARADKNQPIADDINRAPARAAQSRIKANDSDRMLFHTQFLTNKYEQYQNKLWVQTGFDKFRKHGNTCSRSLPYLDAPLKDRSPGTNIERPLAMGVASMALASDFTHDFPDWSLTASPVSPTEVKYGADRMNSSPRCLALPKSSY
ncbi:hypothetical protein [uncultured Cohaesibacter sp.]|uniref:hypothetical protein n=1 Tax=uncultured Cohaesibacter sp. TaxID=1002546 RepID=UPI002931C462|nr:hypothetical protein [uncultured Cohaesibacter sp.]